jgi:RNA polymerase sigma-70 factor (ECF subfamily)
VGIATRSEQRYRSLFDRHGHEVFAFCRRRTDAETAADCAAETFLVAWRRLDDVPDGDAALGWLYGVARRLLANEFRRSRRSQRLVGKLRRNNTEPEPTPEVVVLRRERDQTMLAALARLRPDDQELLRLAWWDGLSHAQLAKMLGCSTQTASQRIHRAARRVAKEYERLDHGRTVAGAPRQLRGGETR